MLSSVTLSTVYLSNISTVLGNDNISVISNQISSSDNNPYSFGGLITVLSSSTLELNMLISECTVTYKTNYIQNSGVLIGLSQSDNNNIQIQRICLKQQTESAQIFKSYGLIGQSVGNMSLQSSSIQFIVTGQAFQFFGIIGLAFSPSQLSQFVNIKINLTNNLLSAGSSFGDTGALIGNVFSIQCKITNATVTLKNGNFSSNVSSGGLVGYCKSTSLQLINSTVQNSILQAIKYCGGFFGSSDKTIFNITNSNLKSVNIISQIGGTIIGSIAVSDIGNAIFNIKLSLYTEITINNNSLSDCQNILNVWSVKQC
ncbi:Hypothetical_protein [Hexamita inflata]|uniref:Hypothetical_protein n=1 Tax=Hexamita inflata TaxID=28002 RepID=A0AA86P9S9_9EUKA|nr:Hypothetical protein HINF_LOCUS22123 [Hexamita inflata]CAI9937931.1 Hypothetical protein HINF_LOCUS25576 [Hexamita inflata]